MPTSPVKIHVEGLMAIEKATLEFEGIGLVAGHNEAGKSTIAGAVASVLTRSPLMHGITKKKDLGRLVRLGHDSGKCFVSLAGGEGFMTWPAGDVETMEELPKISDIAAGITTVSQVDQKDRIIYFSRLLKAGPTGADVSSYLDSAGFDQSEINAAMLQLKKHGWEGGLDYFRELGIEIKGQWRYITGEEYGADKAQTWLPKTWRDGLDQESSDSLQAAVAAAKEDVEAVVGTQAVSAEKIKGLEITVSKLEGQEKHCASLAEQVEAAEFEVSDLLAQQAKLQPRPGAEPLRCPHQDCRRPIKVVVRPGVTEVTPLPEPAAHSPAEMKKIREAHAALDAKLSTAQATLANLRTAKASAHQYLDTIRSARQQLAVIREQQVGDDNSAEVNEKREAVRLAEQDLLAFTQWTEAASKHEAIGRNQVIIDMLKPDGLRQRKLHAALDEFNAVLAEISKQAGLQAPVSLDSDLDLRLGQRSYVLLSYGARFMADRVLQVAVAEREQAPMIIIDGAEILVGPRRRDLVMMLAKRKINALLTMALTKPDQVPDLAKLKVGRNFWVEGGTVS